ncbi:polysaccharide biosynthesis protein [Leuconostoc mesenteroides subsp. mesenteroides]|uniref:glycosyltransferase family 4 protein n=1 Tax=Leuconostoc mesenteroides TaxID=1245 RepID=UPI000E090B18|nr:glycosyltransferase family 4 protein [Leuconostoc mesenteroides]RDF88856.1 polysaccharide biosynthesis protein [Leuconostoc mesenteroides subsp. mesenteroides]
MRITYVLPPNSDTPIGGYKIVYQYANELVNRGHSVNIVFLKNVFPSIKWYSIQYIKNVINKILRRTPKYEQQINWFSIDRRISLYFDVERIKDFPDADAIIATAAPTTYIKNFPLNKGEHFYFIQNYETWWFSGDEKKLLNTFQIPNMTNIVISHELAEKVNNVTTNGTKYLPNFYDPNEFYLQQPLNNRKNIVALLNHTQLTKRTKLGIEILKEVKKEVPDLKVELFGVPDEPQNLPKYFHFTKMATPSQLRNNIFGRAKIYLLPSVLEGWVLTGMEAMASGAAVVASEIGGIVDYANISNSILIKPDHKREFISAIVALLQSDQRQQKIAQKGQKDVQKYRIENSVDILEDILKGK